MITAKVYITLKKGVLDPQGKAIANSLNTMGFKSINDIRQGKFIEISLDEVDLNQAKSLVKSMCDNLLANSVIEDYSIVIDD